MGGATQNLGKTYDAIRLKDEDALNVGVHINYNFPKLHDAFARAAKGEDVVDSALTDELTGLKTRLYRSDPDLKIPEGDFDDWMPITRLLFIEATKRPLTEAENKELNEKTAALAAKTGLTEDYLNARYGALEGKFQDEKEELLRRFDGSWRPSDDGIHIAELMYKRANEGPLSDEERQDLYTSINDYRDTHQLSIEQMSKLLEQYEKRIDSFAESEQKTAAYQFNSVAAAIKTSGGVYLRAPGAAEENIVVPQYKPEALSKFKALGFDPTDLPGKEPPATIEQIQFVIALHESEHSTAMPDRHPVLTREAPMISEQAGEIDADSAVMKFLNDEHNTEFKNYWLQARNVTSFMNLWLGRGHDTSTFLRVQEQTGSQIDLDKFDTEKHDLVIQMMRRMRFNFFAGAPKAGDMMGAISDILKDDQDHPEKKLLSDIQRAEAKQFLADAEALGFKGNPDYPKPGAQPTTRPQPQAPESQPAPM